ncbi:C4-dicarboxylate ABC transporter [Allostella sp. ATCC 35155]|nr:C4-dicarboxylate ABC transporter [Stella sp. ATCC 35155]
MTAAADGTIPPDPEARSGRLHGAAFACVAVLTALGLALSVNQVFNLGLFGLRPISTAYYYMMIGLFLAVAFLAFPAHHRFAGRAPFFDYLLGAAVIAVTAYLATEAQTIISSGWDILAPALPTSAAGLLCLLVLEGIRRAGGPVLFTVAIVFFLYPLYAGVMPGFLWGNDFSVVETVRAHALGMESVIGVPMQVTADILVGYLVFGVVLAATGGGAFFMDFASALMGTSRGGPAKVAVVASGFFGMLSGSPTSNVITTGTLTIPTMKRCGYPAAYAGAVEACASTGGALMPPVMGTAAFIMASFLNVPYGEVALAAFLPALLYYIALILQTDFYAARNGLVGLKPHEVPKLGATLRAGWFYLFCLALLTWLLIAVRIEGEAPYYVSALLVAAAIVGRRLDLRRAIGLLVDCGQAVGQIVALLAGIGMIVGALSITGVGNSFSRELVLLAGGNVYLLLFFGAITSFVLGMGMTASACYIFLAIVLAPALVRAGLDPMASHLYILYWGIVSFITPPVALAAITAASIAKSNAMETGMKAIRIGILLMLLPVLFVLEPALILKGAWYDSLRAFATGVAAAVLLAGAFEGYLPRLGPLDRSVRLVIGLAGCCLLVPELITDIAGAVLLLTGILLARFRPRSMRVADR